MLALERFGLDLFFAVGTDPPVGRPSGRNRRTTVLTFDGLRLNQFLAIRALTGFVDVIH
jgi:hypothetical protein